MDIVPSPELEALVRKKIESGAYRDASEVVADAVERMDERERHAWLRIAVAQGVRDIELGNTVRMTSELREEMIQNAIRRAKAGEKPSADVTPSCRL
jgi:antitoxin ParD1/3/4